jgi:hypothetical protein
MNILFNNKTYTFLKYLVQIGLPAFATLYFTLAGIWGLPNPDEVVGTVVAITTFLGVLLGLSARTYNKAEPQYDGALNIFDDEDERKIFSLDLESQPEELEGKDVVTFKVNK